MFALNSMAGRMTTEQDVEYNRIFLNAYVLLNDLPVVAYD